MTSRTPHNDAIIPLFNAIVNEDKDANDLKSALVTTAIEQRNCGPNRFEAFGDILATFGFFLEVSPFEEEDTHVLVTKRLRDWSYSMLDQLVQSKIPR